MTSYIKQGDCLELMKEIPDGSVDMILCDLPYGTTYCKWDAVIPFEPLWEQYNRVIKDNGPIVLFGAEPFFSEVIKSNARQYRYDWIWIKSKPVGHLRANKQPLRSHENIAVFSKKSPTYFPQDLVAIQPRVIKRTNTGGVYGKQAGMPSVQKFTNYPRTVLSFGVEEGLHPTQKPVALLEYLIKTYTNPGEVVLDNCMGSGSTGVACANTGRSFIGFELDPGYFEIAQKRIQEVVPV
jgi:site-specific DNA-methyltransferase (adenine-specific)